MLIEAVGRRFGNVEAIAEDHTLEFLIDNGTAYIAHEARRVRALQRSASKFEFEDEDFQPV